MKLSQRQIEHFRTEGFVLVEDGLKDSDLDPVIHEYEDYIDQRARQLVEAGAISQLYEDQPFEKRLVHICRENSEIYSELDIMYFRGRALFEFLRNENLLDLVEGLVGPEITCNPIQHLRPKLPAGLTPGGQDAHVAAWHQDMAVMREEADPFFIVTAWLPLAAATPENGCLRIIPRVNGQGLLHQHSAVLQEMEMPEGEALELPMHKGDVLLMHKETPHSSFPNTSDTVRWSMDLRYQPTGTPSGRSFWPDFVVRSRSNPDAMLDDHAEWCRLWTEALECPQGIPAYRWH